MITITIDNSISKIEGLTMTQHGALKNLLSYTIDAQTSYFSRSYRSRRRTLLGRRGDFPTGLLYLVERYLKRHKLTATINDVRKRPEAIRTRFTLTLGLTPRPEQIEASRAVSEHYRGIVVGVTGVGKSVIAALIINELQVNTLVVVPNLELKRQLTESLTACFGAENVGSLGKPIAIENVVALDPKTVQEGYDCVIIDEFHHAGAKTYRELNKKAWTKIFYRAGLTATPFRSNDNERLLLESVLSHVIYRIDYPKAVERGYVVPVEAYYIELPKTRVKGCSWPEVYSELIVNNEARNKVIANLIDSFSVNRISSIVLVKEIKHGENIKKLSSFAELAPYIRGEEEFNKEYLHRFNNQTFPVIIGTTGVLGEGVDTKPTEYVIIAGLGKSKNQFMQQVGRGLRRFEGKESCKVILFYDPSHKFTKRHFEAQIKILKEEYGVKAVRLNLED